MKLISFAFILTICCFLVNCHLSEQVPKEGNPSPFEQSIEGQMVVDYENILWDTRKGSVEEFLSLYGEKISDAKTVTFLGLTNKVAETVLKGISDTVTNNVCKITSVIMRGIRDEECPSMQREQRKRPCKMSREAILREISSVFSKCPLEILSVESNKFSATAVIELAKNVSNLAFPSLKLLDIDDNNYNYDNIAMNKMTRVISEMPSPIEVRSFYAETLFVIQHNRGEDTPFRYNFDSRYPSECHFYSEPIKDEEFELLIKYQPCNYAKSLLAHGTSRGEPWVRYMTTLFSQHKYENMKNMEIFGNDLYLGDVDTFFSLFTDDHFPNLQSIDMSSNGLKSIHITSEMFRKVEKLSLDTNGMSSIIIDDNSLQNLVSLKLGYNQLSEFQIGHNAAVNLKKLYLDNNQLKPKMVKSLLYAPFSKSLTIFSLFSNPTLGEDAEEFVDMFVTAVEEHRFENLKMLYLGQCGLKSYCKKIEEVSKRNIPTLRHVTCF